MLKRELCCGVSRIDSALKLSLEEERSMDILDSKPYRKRIYQGLDIIGSQIAGFYLDGVRIVESKDFISKTILVAHLIREIECGLRDVLDTAKKRTKDSTIIFNEIECGVQGVFQRVKKEEKQDLNNVVEKIECELQEILSIAKIEIQQDNHSKSIMNALDASEEDELAKEWISVVKGMHKKAHRDGVWKEPKNPEIGEKLWDDFEAVLQNLVGTYTLMLDRIDKLVRIEVPTKKNVEKISGLLRVDSIRHYFFKNLNSSYWLEVLNQENYFRLRDDLAIYEIPDSPGYFLTPYWHELDYVKRITVDAAKNNDMLTLRLISKIISDIIENNSGYPRIDNPKIDRLVAEIISRLPKEFISAEMVKYLRIALETEWGNSEISAELSISVLPNLMKINQKEMVCTLLEMCFSLSKKGYCGTTMMDNFWLDEFIKKNIVEIATLCGNEIINLCLEKLNVFSIGDDKYQYYTETFTKTSLQNMHFENYEQALIITLVGVIDNIENANVGKLMNSLLKQEHTLLRRLKIYILNKHFTILSSFFWKLIENPIDEETEGELLELIEYNCEYFTDNQQQILLEWIKKADFYIPSKYVGNNEMIEKIQKYRRLKFLEALNGIRNEEVQNLQIQYSNETKDLIEPVKVTGLPSKDEMIKKTNNQIVDTIRSKYEEINLPRMETILLTLFEAVIEDDPKKISSDMRPFLQLPWCYKNKLVHCFARAKITDEEINWTEVIGFIHEIVQDDNYWDSMGSHNHDPYRLVLGSIFNILEYLIDEKVFSSIIEIRNKYESVLALLTERIGSTAKIGEDHTDMRLGNHLARTFCIILEYHFQLNKLDMPKTCRNWAINIFLEQANLKKTPELFAVIGAYLRKLVKMEPRLTMEMCKKFPDTEELFFQTAFVNYLTYYSWPTIKVYKKLKALGYYQRAIKLKMPKEANNALVFHLVVGFFHGWEDGDQFVLLEKLISEKDFDHLKEVLKNISIKSEHILTNDLQNKIKKAWNQVYNQVKDQKHNPAYREVVANLIKPIIGVTLLDSDIWDILKTAVTCPQGKYSYYR